MNSKVTDALNGNTDNYIFPFFWQTGDTKEKLETEMTKIAESGVKAVCLESRTHEHFCEEEWFDDFAFILSVAKKSGMKVWLLDDKHFPTGYANGKIATDYPQHRQWHIIEKHIDVVGPLNGTLLINAAGENHSEDERILIAALAVKREEREEILTDDVIEITDNLKGDFLYWSVPSGCYRIFLIYKTREGSYFDNYIDMISEESVDVLINEVYEKHYDRFKDEFGNTFAGFFSDEPCFANGKSGGSTPGFYEYKIGLPNVAYPWCDAVKESMSEFLGVNAVMLLPALWYPMGDKTASVRLAYMNSVTSAYRDCFSKRVGDWCRNHNVEYIGHVVEDMGCHARLGPGAGHYFRALEGQDMAGVDVVLQQIMPAMSRFTHTSMVYCGYAESQYFDYILAKLAVSFAHLNPKMKGRAMCEMYGAYGWAEGVPLMKWLTDHMLVRGINRFVPHAFTTRYPNPDCPPHFYAEGHYNQYRDFSKLMEYTNRMCHLFEGSKPVVKVTLLYDAEFEWCGGKYMRMQEPAQVMYDSHIDYDIVPTDYLLNNSSVLDGCLSINGECFEFLVIPFTEIIPLYLWKRLCEFKEKGLKIYFVGGVPSYVAKPDGTIATDDCGFTEISLAALSVELQNAGASDVTFSGNYPYLRCLHRNHSDYDVFMFFNESNEPVNTEVSLPCVGNYAVLDVLGECCSYDDTVDGKCEISLDAGQSVLLFFDKSIPASDYSRKTEKFAEVSFDGEFEIIGRKMLSDVAEFSFCGELVDITAANMYPNFTGIIVYNTAFCVPKAEKYILKLGEVGETATVYINGKKAAHMISNPYTADITDYIGVGENEIIVEVANSMVYSERDYFSKGIMVSRSGLLGPVKIECFK